MSMNVFMHVELVLIFLTMGGLRSRCLSDLSDEEDFFFLSLLALMKVKSLRHRKDLKTSR